MDLKIQKINNAYIGLICEDSILYDLSDYFTFMVEGYYFTPAYKKGFWDGKIRLIDRRNRSTYYGLIHDILNYCKERNYEVSVSDELRNQNPSLDIKEATDFISSLNIPEKFELRDYQIDSLVKCINHQRLIFLSPTGSGKSLLLYYLIRYFGKKTLLIEDRTSLVYQICGDFEDYGYDTDKYCHKIISGKEKISNKPVFITTWQSIYKLPKEWFEQFEMIIGDEVHGFKAKSLISIMQNLVNCDIRIGVSGTLDGSQINEMVLRGLFGPIIKGPTTKELMDLGYLSDIKIKNLILKYPLYDINSVKKMEYQEEIDFLLKHEKRNNFIKKLTLSLKGNTLLLYERVDKHGKILYNLIKENESSRKIFFIHGGVDGEYRNQIRAIVEREKDAIILASLGTSQKGINIKNLHNIIYVHPFKGQIITLQSIGRGLRVGEDKNFLTLYDIVDDLSYENRGKKYTNYSLDHFLQRAKLYMREGFEFKTYNLEVL